MQGNQSGEAGRTAGVARERGRELLTMMFWEKLLWIELGILSGLAFPWARAVVARHLGRGEGGRHLSVFWQRVYWAGEMTWRYGKLLAASTVFAFVLLMLAPRMLGWPVETVEQAFLVGFFADSIGAKLFRENPVEGGGPLIPVLAGSPVRW